MTGVATGVRAGHALAEIERLWHAPEGSDDGDKLDILAALVERYEQTRWRRTQS